MKNRTRIILLVVVVGGIAAVYLGLPPRPRNLSPLSVPGGPAPRNPPDDGAGTATNPPSTGDGTATSRNPPDDGVRGAIHIHTTRSDGTGTVEEVAAAAARAGLRFVILTDHGDASSEPTPPVYRDGVLCIDAVEISTDGGHIVALALPRAPYPLAGEPRDVLEDISRLGGSAIVAHPGSEKPALQWTDWTLPFGGLEWLNGDSEWRDEGAPSLARGLLSYPFRRAETLVTLLDRPEAVLRHWDELTARRRVVAVAAGDAHARIALRDRDEPYNDPISVHLPAYEEIFRAFSITVSPVTLTGDAAADALTVLDAVRRGHVYSSVDALAGPAAMSFSATRGSQRAVAGDVVQAGAAIVLQVDSNAPQDGRMTLLKNGAPLTTVDGASLQQTVAGEAAVYRVEIHLPGAPGAPPVPWVVSNPIYVRAGPADDPAPPPRPKPKAFAVQYENGPATGWRIEKGERSLGALDEAPAPGGRQVSLRWGLGGTLSEGPYVALVMPAGAELAAYDRLVFTARATRPMRISVQVRAPQARNGERWHRSVYIDESPRDITIFFDEMMPRGVTAQPRPALPDVRDVLFVVDTVNTKPGASGQVWIDNVKYGR